jgi:hypothetical protein
LWFVRKRRNRAIHFAGSQLWVAQRPNLRSPDSVYRPLQNLAAEGFAAGFAQSGHQLSSAQAGGQ